MSLLGRAFACATVLSFCPAAHAADFESPAELDAEAHLGKEVLAGPHHRIEPRVLNDGRTNVYRVGDGTRIMEAAGDRLARERAREFEAIAALEKIKQSDAYAKGLDAAANATLTLTRTVIEDPVGALNKLPQGLGTLLSDLGAAVEGMGRGRDAPREDNAMVKDLIGFNTLKHRLAHEMKVDPYSSHAELQKGLNDVAWAMFAGGAPIDLALTAAPAGLTIAIRAADRAEGGELDWRLPPATLRQAMEREVRALGLADRESESLVYHRVCSLRHQSLLVAALVDMKPAAGRDAVLRAATSAADERACRDWLHRAELAWIYHRQVGLVAGIELRAGQLWLRGRGGAEVLVMPADWFAWTPANAALFPEAPSPDPATAGMNTEPPATAAAPAAQPARLLWLEGRASPRAREALAALGVTVAERVIEQHPAALSVAAVLLPERSAPQAGAGENQTGKLIEGVTSGVGNALGGVLQGLGLSNETEAKRDAAGKPAPR